MSRNLSYFVTVEGIEVKSNLAKEQAINEAKKQFEKNKELGMISIGIGKKWYKDGKMVYTLFPMFLF